MQQIIKLADIDMSVRKRPIDEAHRDLIAASIEFKGRGRIGEGLDTPFIIEPFGHKWRGVTGGHRHAALVVSGWTEVEVGKHVKIVEGLDDFGRQLTEIDENLCRHDLNALDRALFIAERKALCREDRRKNGGDRKSSKFKEEISSATCGTDFSPRFTLEVAEKVGLSEDTVTRALRIAEKLDKTAIGKLRGTKIERNQQALLALCDLSADEQVEAAEFIASGEAKTVAEARVAIGKDKAPSTDPQPRILATLLEAWTKASRTTKATFLAEIGADYVKSDARGSDKPKKAAQ